MLGLFLKPKEDFIPKTTPNKRRPGTKLNATSITIHNTGNPSSTAKNERGWLTNPSNTRTASWHYVVDEKEIILAIPVNEIAYHAGTANGNSTSIGIEICESGDQKIVWKNAVGLTAQLLFERNWDIDKVRTHKSWSGKECPRLILPRWNEFLNDTKETLEHLKKEATKVANKNDSPKEIEPWKLTGLQELAKENLVSDYEGWEKQINDPIPAWAVMTIINNVFKKLRKEK